MRRALMTVAVLSGFAITLAAYANSSIAFDAEENDRVMKEAAGSLKSRRCGTLQTWTNCIGTLTYSNGEKYVGEFRDDLPNGQGTRTYLNGEKYVGEFRDGFPYGPGKSIFPDGGTYVGEFYNNTRDGLGTRIWANGDKYVGEFRDGKEHGQGTYTWLDGAKYVGEFSDGKAHGQGTYIWPDGAKYVGKFRGGEYHGRGTAYSADGSVVASGRWSNGTFVESAEASPKPGRPPTTSEAPTPSEKYDTTGSGFTVSSDGFVLTNHHVVEKCQTVTVHDRGPAVIRSLDEINDLALLKIEGKTSAMPFRASTPGLGNSVFALGFPFSGVLGSGVNFTGGLISALSGMRNDSRYLQFTAPIQPGNSGGPLVNAEGLVVGVVTSRLPDIPILEASGALPQNVNFAIRGDIAKGFLRANGVEPIIAEARNTLSASEIAKKAQAYTVQIICHQDQSEAPSASYPTPDRSRKADPLPKSPETDSQQIDFKSGLFALSKKWITLEGDSKKGVFRTYAALFPKGEQLPVDIPNLFVLNCGDRGRAPYLTLHFPKYYNFDGFTKDTWLPKSNVYIRTQKDTLSFEAELNANEFHIDLTDNEFDDLRYIWNSDGVIEMKVGPAEEYFRLVFDGDADALTREIIEKEKAIENEYSIEAVIPHCLSRGIESQNGKYWRWWGSIWCPDCSKEEEEGETFAFYEGQPVGSEAECMKVRNFTAEAAAKNGLLSELLCLRIDKDN